MKGLHKNLCDRDVRNFLYEEFHNFSPEIVAIIALHTKMNPNLQKYIDFGKAVCTNSFIRESATPKHPF